MKDDKHRLEIPPQAAGWDVMDLDTGEVDAVMGEIRPAIAKHFLAGTLPAAIAVALLNLAVEMIRAVHGVETAIVNLRGLADSLEEDGDPLEMEPPVGNA